MKDIGKERDTQTHIESVKERKDHRDVKREIERERVN